MVNIVWETDMILSLADIRYTWEAIWEDGNWKQLPF